MTDQQAKRLVLKKLKDPHAMFRRRFYEILASRKKPAIRYTGGIDVLPYAYVNLEDRVRRAWNEFRIYKRMYASAELVEAL